MEYGNDAIALRPLLRRRTPSTRKAGPCLRLLLHARAAGPMRAVNSALCWAAFS